MKTIYSPSYGNLIRKLRDARVNVGLTQEQAGRAIAKGRNWVSLVETTQLRLDVLHFCLMCAVYSVSAPDMIRDLERESRAELRSKTT